MSNLPELVNARNHLKSLTVVRLMGGLGNQLFQYGFAISLKHKGYNIVLDTSWYSEGQEPSDAHFRKPDLLKLVPKAVQCGVTTRLPKTILSKIIRRLQAGRASKGLRYLGNRNLQMIFDRQAGFDPSLYDVRGNVCIEGYFQDEKYIEPVRPDLLQLIEHVSGGVTPKQLFGENDCQTVSIHIRRGDYLKHSGTYPVCSPEYFYSAITEMRMRYSNPRFLIFTDDPDWFFLHRDEMSLDSTSILAKEHCSSDIDELVMMSRCDHHIISNSTFSWMGAWLNTAQDKFVIAPKQWMHGENYNSLNQSIVPGRWLRI